MTLQEKLISFLHQSDDQIDVVLAGESFVDLESLSIDSFEEAHSYMKNYGYDLDNPQHAEQVRAILSEAKSFVQSYLLEDPEGKMPSLVIPPNIQWEDDVRNLLVMASEKEKTLTQRWSCAMLRVAHTITHVENDLSRYFFQGIKKQVFSRFMAHLHVTNKGEYYLGRGLGRIKLRLFEMKSEKSRESLIMKLLHKKENVTADVFDRVGVRIVTIDKVDVLCVLRYLEEHHVISFANVKPSRTHNSLLSFSRFIKGLRALSEKNYNAMTETEVREFIEPYLTLDESEEKESREKIRENNPYSSTLYTSLQLTSRQLITIQDPFNINLSYKFFFPFELQILDWDNYLESRTGRASHEEYKKNQIVSVRKRVLGGVISYHMRQAKRAQR